MTKPTEPSEKLKQWVRRVVQLEAEIDDCEVSGAFEAFGPEAVTKAKELKVALAQLLELPGIPPELVESTQKDIEQERDAEALAEGFVDEADRALIREWQTERKRPPRRRRRRFDYGDGSHDDDDPLDIFERASELIGEDDH